MNFRDYVEGDLHGAAELFYETVHFVNCADYTEDQLFAWAENRDSLKSRSNDLINQRTIVAEADGKIVGFGSIDCFGELDLLYVHKDYQRQGIACAICNELEKGFPCIKTYASVTAKPFFEKRGYATVRERLVERRGIKLKNYEMVKAGD